MSMLEAKAEDLFSEALRKAGYTKENGVSVERQACSIEDIDYCFRNASKTEGSNRKGYPDFIVTNKTYPGIVMLAECKASNADHKQAVQEACHYAKFLYQKFDVIIVAVSGTTEETLLIDTAVVRKDMTAITPQNTPTYDDKSILTLDAYEKFIGYTARVEQGILQSMQELQNDINWILYEAGNLNSDKRMLILSACLLGLRNKGFRDSYPNFPKERLLSKLLGAVEDVLEDYEVPIEKRNTMVKNFKTLEQLDVLTNGTVNPDGYIIHPIKSILDKIHTSKIHGALENDVLNIDIMGNFYNEFITHGQDMGNAKNGFVLTPRHICELFAELGEVNENTKMLDMCFGTGGFLVAGMQKAILSAKGNEEAIKEIKRNNICGVELDGDRFTYGCVNMILRGDGKSNMEQGDCFKLKETMVQKKCSVGFINPPYALPTSELAFVENMLDCLEVGGRGIAIIPMSCATDKTNKTIPIKQRILSKHTLEAVLSMPDQLFYPAAGVVTCVMIFTAHKPHNSERKTWFARCKDDGLVIDRKSKGRADINNKWNDIKKQWVDAFIERDVINGFSVKHAVTANDEWSYEAYAKTDFSGITEDSFKKVVKEYALFQLSQLEV